MQHCVYTAAQLVFIDDDFETSPIRNTVPVQPMEKSGSELSLSENKELSPSSLALPRLRGGSISSGYGSQQLLNEQQTTDNSKMAEPTNAKNPLASDNSPGAPNKADILANSNKSTCSTSASKQVKQTSHDSDNGKDSITAVRSQRVTQSSQCDNVSPDVEDDGQDSVSSDGPRPASVSSAATVLSRSQPFHSLSSSTVPVATVLSPKEEHPPLGPASKHSNTSSVSPNRDRKLRVFSEMDLTRSRLYEAQQRAARENSFDVTRSLRNLMGSSSTAGDDDLHVLNVLNDIYKANHSDRICSHSSLTQSSLNVRSDSQRRLTSTSSTVTGGDNSNDEYEANVERSLDDILRKLDNDLKAGQPVVKPFRSSKLANRSTPVLTRVRTGKWDDVKPKPGYTRGHGLFARASAAAGSSLVPCYTTRHEHEQQQYSSSVFSPSEPPASAGSAPSKQFPVYNATNGLYAGHLARELSREFEADEQEAANSGAPSDESSGSRKNRSKSCGILDIVGKDTDATPRGSEADLSSNTSLRSSSGSFSKTACKPASHLTALPHCDYRSSQSDINSAAEETTTSREAEESSAGSSIDQRSGTLTRSRPTPLPPSRKSSMKTSSSTSTSNSTITQAPNAVPPINRRLITYSSHRTRPASEYVHSSVFQSKLQQAAALQKAKGLARSSAAVNGLPMRQSRFAPLSRPGPTTNQAHSISDLTNVTRATLVAAPQRPTLMPAAFAAPMDKSAQIRQNLTSNATGGPQLRNPNLTRRPSSQLLQRIREKRVAAEMSRTSAQHQPMRATELAITSMTAANTPPNTLISPTSAQGQPVRSGINGHFTASLVNLTAIPNTAPLDSASSTQQTQPRVEGRRTVASKPEAPDPAGIPKKPTSTTPLLAQTTSPIPFNTVSASGYTPYLSVANNPLLQQYSSSGDSESVLLFNFRQQHLRPESLSPPSPRVSSGFGSAPESPPSIPATGPVPAPRRVHQQRQQARTTHQATHRFVPRHNDELHMEVGDPILLNRENDDLWSEGINLRTRRKGIFPTSFAKKLHHRSSTNSRTRVSSPPTNATTAPTTSPTPKTTRCLPGVGRSNNRTIQPDQKKGHVSSSSESPPSASRSPSSSTLSPSLGSRGSTASTTSFDLYYLGSMQVREHSGQPVLNQAIYKVILARRMGVHEPPVRCVLEVNESGIVITQPVPSQTETRNTLPAGQNHQSNVKAVKRETKQKSFRKRVSQFFHGSKNTQAQDTRSAHAKSSTATLPPATTAAAPVQQETFFFSLRNISFYNYHSSDRRYMAFIARQPGHSSIGQPAAATTENNFIHSAHVFMSQKSLQNLVQCITAQMQQFYRQYDEFMAFSHPTEDIYIE